MFGRCDTTSASTWTARMRSRARNKREMTGAAAGALIDGSWSAGSVRGVEGYVPPRSLDRSEERLEFDKGR